MNICTRYLYVFQIGESRSFSILNNPLHLFKYKNDIESFVLRQGCSLRVYKDSDFSDSEYVFSAPPHRDLIIRDLEDNPATEYLGKLNFEVVVSSTINGK